jgi:ATP-dependent DNA helicase RecG
MPFLRNTLKRGFLYIFRGRVTKKGKAYCMEQPKCYTPAEYQELEKNLQPVYPLVQGLTNKMVSKAVRQALEQMPNLDDPFPEEIRKRYQLAEYSFALANIHMPTSKDDLLIARRRLVFEEFYRFVCRIRSMEEHWDLTKNECIMHPVPATDTLLERLPYELTGAQKKVWKEISDDLQGEKLMSRLVQGDVGSGKTILAFLALLTAKGNGYQGAMMVPTEVLAKQHLCVG